MQVRRFVLAASLASVAGLGACAPAMKTGGEEPFGAAMATVTVENNSWQDMTVYAVRDGIRARLGSVSSLGKQEFRLSSAMMTGTGHLRIMADPLGSSRQWFSEPIMIGPGQQLRFKLENNIQLSSYTMYNR